MKKANSNSTRILSEETRKKMSKASVIRNKQIWTSEKRKQHSIKMKSVVSDNPDSYASRNICGRTKRIPYGNTYVNGNWELCVAKWLDTNNIRWTNNVMGIPYIWNSNEHLYFPDFYLLDYDIYVEVKGYERDRDRCKWKAVKNLKVIKKKEIDLISNNLFDINNFLILK